ncbi:MAG: hypothetical protein JSS62_06785 [Verrucomicrobia bacterium]|nr:hypothetical protein [Verrucomicrobiota bacterium]MBS0645572.1 hypothetical protein [Verrucomicrobiota bacterium]
MIAGISSSLGYYTKNTYRSTVTNFYFKPGLVSYENVAFKYLNRLNFLGYIPVVGAVMGSIRVEMMRYGNSRPPSGANEKEQGTREFTAFVISQIVRGFFEFIGAGLLFVIPDLVVTLIRNPVTVRRGSNISMSSYKSLEPATV